ncbi:hypothetical protein C8A01DRAFT_41510 [Parachaetomium inaequale]|uniref:Uncharacterized protein n=1 Tax=Parachaetomium inaequale TaxID=2588326 RepID=A0AAN6P9R0_9PEZI|nr:hypothetical protein C8A01DRAFT_41510 [Parachaetomium inaequale]
MQTTNEVAKGATGKAPAPAKGVNTKSPAAESTAGEGVAAKAPGAVGDGTNTTTNRARAGKAGPPAPAQKPVARTELSRGKVPAAAKKRVAVKTTTTLPAQPKEALAPAPTPAPTGPFFKPGQIALRHGVAFVLHEDGTWQRHIFASAAKGEAPVDVPVPGARGHRARAHLPGAIFATSEHEVVIGKDGVGRPLEPDHAPRPAHLCCNEVWPSAEPHLPSNLVRIGGRLNQLLPDGSWRRVVVSVAPAAATTTTATPVAPSPSPAPSPPPAHAVGTIVSVGAQGVQYMLQADRTWRPLDASLSAALRQISSGKAACPEEGCVWDEGDCAAPSAEPAVPEQAPETPAAADNGEQLDDNDAVVESALPAAEMVSSTATSPAPGPVEAIESAVPAVETTGSTTTLADPTVPAFVPAPEPKKPRTGTRRHRGRRGPSEQEIQQRVEQEVQRRLGQMNVVGGVMAPMMNMNMGGWGMPQQGYGYGPMYGQGGYGYGEQQPYGYLG